MSTDKLAQIIISAIVVLGFGGVAIAWMIAPPHAENKDIILLIVGGLNSGYGVVIGFWFARPKEPLA